MDMKIGFILTELAVQEQAELYKCAMENILSNSFLSDLTRDFLNVFHSFCLYKLAILKEGIFPTHLSYDHLRRKKGISKINKAT
jgi:hypothetical protein